jgi:hypothetical protein
MTQVAPEDILRAPSRPVQRYVPAPLSGALHWGVFDTVMGGWCSLAYGSCLLPLAWHSKEEAQVWLYLCRVAWGSGLVDAPEGWNGA